MKLFEELKIDLLGCIKYMTKLSKEISRMKKILNSFSFALINGLIYFYVVKNTIILLVFMFSASMLLYFILCNVYSMFVVIRNRIKK